MVQCAKQLRAEAVQSQWWHNSRGGTAAGHGGWVRGSNHSAAGAGSPLAGRGPFITKTALLKPRPFKGGVFNAMRKRRVQSRTIWCKTGHDSPFTKCQICPPFADSPILVWALRVAGSEGASMSLSVLFFRWPLAQWWILPFLHPGNEKGPPSTSPLW